MNAMRFWVMWLLVLAVPAVGQTRDEWRAELRKDFDMATTAITRWTNALGNGAWVDGNWSAGKPDATYGGYFDGSVQDDVISSLDQGTVQTPFIHRGENYNGNIGTVGNPLIISTSLLWLEGSGYMNFQNGDGTTTQVVVDAFTMGNPSLLDGDIRYLWVLKGEATTGSSFNTGGNNIITHVGTRGGVQDAKLTIPAISAALPLIVQRSGIIDFEVTQSITALQLSGGHFNHDANASSLANAYVTGGRLTGIGPTTIGALYLLGGTGDFSVDGDPKVMSLFRMPGTTFLQNNNMAVTDSSPIPINQE